MAKLLILLSEAAALSRTESLQESLKDFTMSYQLRLAHCGLGAEDFKSIVKEFEEHAGDFIINFSSLWELQGQSLLAVSTLPILHVAYKLSPAELVHNVNEVTPAGFFGFNEAGLRNAFEHIARLLARFDPKFSRVWTQFGQQQQMNMRKQDQDIRIDYASK